VLSVSPDLYLEPGMSNASGKLVHLEVDGDLLDHSSPQQQLMEDEFIEVMLFPLDDLLASLLEYQKENSCTIDAKLYTFAFGLDLARKYKS